jgi:hypothetical protein
MQCTEANKNDAMRTAPLADLLTDLELDLCVKLPMFPKYYLEAKRVILREASKYGDLSLQTVQRVLNVSESSNFFFLILKSFSFLLVS